LNGIQLLGNHLALFENHLKSIVKHIFNPVALGRKVDGYKERLDEEMRWDTSLPRLHTGTKSFYHFTYKDFIDGIECGVSSPYGIMDWTKVIADTVCKQFNMEYDTNPSIPEAPVVFRPTTTVALPIATTTTSMNQPTMTSINQDVKPANNSNNDPVNSGVNQTPITNVNSESGALSKYRISMTFIVLTIVFSFLFFY